MGGAVSVLPKHRKRKSRKSNPNHIQISSSSYGSQIEVDTLYTALKKLWFILENNESLSTTLTDEIMSPKHVTFNDQFVGVKKWINKHGAGPDGTGATADLTAEEIDYLIQFVELYFDENYENSSTLAIGNKSPSGKSCPLMCPYRNDLAALTAEIRSQEAKRLSAPCFNMLPEDSTVNIRMISDPLPQNYLGTPQSSRFSDNCRSSGSFSERRDCSFLRSHFNDNDEDDEDHEEEDGEIDKDNYKMGDGVRRNSIEDVRLPTKLYE